jgi:uncharacterized protein YgiM (DUF1202 family)
MHLLLAAALAAPCAALAAQNATINADTELRASPAADAKVLKTLSSGSAVQVFTRKGGWYEAQAEPKLKGWVKMLRVSFASGSAEAGGGSALSTLGKVVRSSSSGVHVGTGVRGLDEENLMHAQPKPAEVEKLKKLGASEADAKKFAGQGKLASTKVDYLSEGGGLSMPKLSMPKFNFKGGSKEEPTDE